MPDKKADVDLVNALLSMQCSGKVVRLKARSRADKHSPPIDDNNFDPVPVGVPNVLFVIPGSEFEAPPSFFGKGAKL